MLAPILGHDEVLERFRRAVARGRLASTFLFIGPAGIGKRTTALKVAQHLLCDANQPRQFNACGRCESCQQVAANTHPDLIVVQRPPGDSMLSIDLFVGDDEHRMQVGLCHDIGLKPMRGGRKVAIVDDADFFSVEAANCLLKTLEEPPPKSVLILLGTSLQKQLPTIRSRCQIVRFNVLTDDQVARLLVEKQLIDEPARAAELARYAQGSLARAVEWSDPALRDFCRRLLEQLQRGTASSAEFVKELSGFVDEAGKEAPPRRARLCQLIGIVTELYRELLLRLSCGQGASEDPLVRAAAETLHSRWVGDCETAAACLERCLDAEAHVLSFANQATLIECWLDDLDQTTRLGYRPS